MVTMEAEWADPELGEEIDDGERVEDGATGAASEWGVREERDVREGLDWSVDGGDWDYAGCRVLFGSW